MTCRIRTIHCGGHSQLADKILGIGPHRGQRFLRHVDGHVNHTRSLLVHCSPFWSAMPLAAGAATSIRGIANSAAARHNPGCCRGRRQSATVQRYTEAWPTPIPPEERRATRDYPDRQAKIGSGTACLTYGTAEPQEYIEHDVCIDREKAFSVDVRNYLDALRMRGERRPPLRSLRWSNDDQRFFAREGPYGHRRRHLHFAPEAFDRGDMGAPAPGQSVRP